MDESMTTRILTALERSKDRYGAACAVAVLRAFERGENSGGHGFVHFARTKNRPRGSPIAHGRKAVRTQSAILYKNNPKPLLLLSITVLLVRMFLSVPKARLARAARKFSRRM